MKKFTRAFASTAVAALAASALVACGGGGDTEGPNVYFLNFKPEQDATYQAIAEEYTAETGVPVKVVTAASGRP